MNPRQILPRFILLASFLTVVLTCSPVSAGTINVGGSLFFSGSSAMLLTGDRGFTASGIFFPSIMAGAFDCHTASMVSVPGITGCGPGSLVTPGLVINPTFSGRGPVAGAATLEDRFVGLGGQPPSPFGNIVLAFVGPPVIVPPLNVAEAVTLTNAGGSFTGTFFHVDSTSPPISGTETLEASGRATVSLRKGTHPDVGETWFFDSVRYDLEPTPEPATLLLFGTSIAGIGFAARQRRQKS
jgi:hypothetical protein